MPQRGAAIWIRAPVALRNPQDSNRYFRGLAALCQTQRLKTNASVPSGASWQETPCGFLWSTLAGATQHSVQQAWVLRVGLQLEGQQLQVFGKEGLELGSPGRQQGFGQTQVFSP